MRIRSYPHAQPSELRLGNGSLSVNNSRYVSRLQAHDQLGEMWMQ
jgi:hypothetical protein